MKICILLHCVFLLILTAVTVFSPNIVKRLVFVIEAKYVFLEVEREFGTKFRRTSALHIQNLTELNEFSTNAQCLSPAANSNIPPSVALRFSLYNGQLCFQPTFTRRTSGHSLGNFTVENFSSISYMKWFFFFFFFLLLLLLLLLSSVCDVQSAVVWSLNQGRIWLL